ncbi:hypothetical protein, partial [Salmonella enterica]|uniref:hypothetical protein n=1 Tax=Salmonella enterica TaxID=28901 RepID=UPI001F2ECABA
MKEQAIIEFLGATLEKSTGANISNVSWSNIREVYWGKQIRQRIRKKYDSTILISTERGKHDSSPNVHVNFKEFVA